MLLLTPGQPPPPHLRESAINVSAHTQGRDRAGTLSTASGSSDCYRVFKATADPKLSVRGFTWISRSAWAQRFEVAILFQPAACNSCVLSLSKPSLPANQNKQ